MIDHKKLKDVVYSTGFPFEYEIQKKLEAHGWDVVSNRYYIDDLKRLSVKLIL